MNVENFLDSTYLKLPEQSGLTTEETRKKVIELTDEAINYHFFEVMIRPEYVHFIKNYIKEKGASVKTAKIGRASCRERV